jgi:hypothetical protein
MKLKDIMVIAVLSIFAGVFGLLLDNSVIASEKSLVTKVEVAEPISSSFEFKDKTYFGPGAINPTKNITIDGNNTTSPLGK